MNEDIDKIRKVLKATDNPLSYLEISEQTGIDEKTVFQIVGKYFREITKTTTHTAIPHEDFFLFGDNIQPISNNFGYKVIKSRLNIGQKTSRLTHGVLR